MPKAGKHVAAPGIRAVLAVVAILPLTVSVWLTLASVTAARDESAAAVGVGAESGELSELIRIDGALTVESFWAGALAAIEELGLPVELVASLIGVDVTGQYVAAQGDLDEHIADAGLEVADELDGLGEVLLEAREFAASGPASRELYNRYTPVSRLLDGAIAEELEELEALIDTMPHSGDVARAMRTLQLAVDMREATSKMASGLFAARFPAQSSDVDPAGDLLTNYGLYVSFADRLASSLGLDSAAAHAWEQLEADDQVQLFVGRASSTRDLIVTSGGDAVAIGVAGFDLSEQASILFDSLVALEAHVGLVEAAGEDLRGAAQHLEGTAASAQTAAIATAVAAVGISILAVAVAAWWIIRPLRQMEAAVDRIRRGELGHHVREDGPIEVRMAARALNEAADHLELAERQAVALAEEDLTNPVLQRTAPGKLGESLQGAVSRLATSLTEQEDFRRRLTHEATHDGLTGLPNRSAIIASLEQAQARVRRSGSQLAVLFIDLDGFKQVNDLNGHAAGDHLLRTVARRIAAAMRQGDQVGRLGGDEFLVVAEPVGSADEAVAVASRVLDEITKTITYGTVEVTPGASIGVAVTSSDDLTADEIVRDADLAVYRAKELGRGRIEVCDVHLRDELAHRVDIESALRRGLQNGELTVHYQPITDTRQGGLVGVEALVRWERPDHGLVGPEAFIPVAERSDLIVDLDRWVLQTAAAQMGAWAEHPVLSHLSVSVNLSARHLTAPTLVSDVLGALSTHGVQPERLTLEVTESALLNDLDLAATHLRELRKHGISVAIDDFGTGYTSLALLRQLPIDVLKIDRSFISNLDRSEDRSLVKLIVETGHLLGVSITAEGVETNDQIETLTELGSDRLQGFRFSRAITAEDLESAVSTGDYLEPVEAAAAERG